MTAKPLRGAVDWLARKNLHRWMGGYLRHLAANVRAPRVDGPRHLLFALCDHYEPLWGDATDAVGEDRVRAWDERYPAVVDGFRDCHGFAPRHSFFFPGEQYRPSYIERLARLARAGLGEVELHLHHDGDTAATLAADIARYLESLAHHGHLSRDPDGRLRYAFIHGNWCLANARADGTMCGVDEEVALLFDTGCYADFTFPAAPDEAQPNIVNQIYWPTGDLRRRRSYEEGERARVGVRRDDRILIVEGPLALARKSGRVPVRIENSALDGWDPPNPTRVHSWAAQNIHVQGRPEWVFVKAHTHGAPEANAASLLGDGSRTLHRVLTGHYNDGQRWKLHYVTAREMYNIAIAAMDGKSGDPSDYRDYALPPPPVVG